MRRPKRIALIVVFGLVAAVAPLFWWVGTSEFGAEDACLDAGGRWSGSGSCAFE